MMFETKFFINGVRVDQAAAKRHWFASNTYKMANRETRDQIWMIALNGDHNGNHNPEGEVEHLQEAGIELRA